MADSSGWCFCTPPHESHSPHRLGEGACLHASKVTAKQDDPFRKLIEETKAWINAEGSTQPAAMSLLARWMGATGHGHV